MQSETNVTSMPEKINLIYLEKINAAFVYNVNDWETLRKKYRIIGNILGHTQFIPALPLKLNPEEVVFLLKNGKANLVKYPGLELPPDEQCKETIANFLNQLFSEEKMVYINLRKNELNLTLEKIIAGKRKHGDTRSDKIILDEELKKSSTVSEDALIWPTFTTPVDGIGGNSTLLPPDTIFTYVNETKCLVYEDLWKKGFFITSGQKFGADFLVYLGDPVLFHAVYIVKCIEDRNRNIHSSELVAFGRLGTSVKKKAVLASLNADNTVTYITLNWMDSVIR